MILYSPFSEGNFYSVPTRRPPVPQLFEAEHSRHVISRPGDKK